MIKGDEMERYEFSEIVRGLLYRFIKIKMAGYAEPTRKGTPKGEPIGMSRKKFHAALLCLTNIPLVEIAGLVGTSHNMIRVWRTELAFKKKVEDLSEEFENSITFKVTKDADNT
jgi:hypothetical protein